MTEDAGGGIVCLDLEITAIVGEPPVEDLQYADAPSTEMEGDRLSPAVHSGAAFDMQNHAVSARPGRDCSFISKVRSDAGNNTMQECNAIKETNAMYLDHPKISATNSGTEPDRIERLNRVYGYAVALADAAGDKEFLGKLSHLHDHKGTLMVVWFEEPNEPQKGFFVSAWKSKVGDESANVEHEVKEPGT
jgi:hypothetical protein